MLGVPYDYVLLFCRRRTAESTFSITANLQGMASRPASTPDDQGRIFRPSYRKRQFDGELEGPRKRSQLGKYSKPDIEDAVKDRERKVETVSFNGLTATLPSSRVRSLASQPESFRTTAGRLSERSDTKYRNRTPSDSLSRSRSRSRGWEEPNPGSLDGDVTPAGTPSFLAQLILNVQQHCELTKHELNLEELEASSDDAARQAQRARVRYARSIQDERLALLYPPADAAELRHDEILRHMSDDFFAALNRFVREHQQLILEEEAVDGNRSFLNQLVAARDRAVVCGIRAKIGMRHDELDDLGWSYRVINENQHTVTKA